MFSYLETVGDMVVSCSLGHAGFLKLGFVELPWAHAAILALVSERTAVGRAAVPSFPGLSKILSETAFAFVELSLQGHV